MAFRGGRGGRGRGRGGMGAGSYVKPVPFILFPEDVILPDVKGVPEELALVRWNLGLQRYWKYSPYYLEEKASKKSEDNEIERYSDRNKDRNKTTTQTKRGSLSEVLVLNSFPSELTAGKGQPVKKKARWNPESESGVDLFEKFEKLEEKFGDKLEKSEKEKKEGDDDDDDEEVEVEDGDYSDDGDYNQMLHEFDDDDDDFNMDDGGDDDPTY